MKMPSPFTLSSDRKNSKVNGYYVSQTVTIIVKATSTLYIQYYTVIKTKIQNMHLSRARCNTSLCLYNIIEPVRDISNNFFMFFPIYANVKHVTPGAGTFFTQGHNLNKLGPLGHATGL